jgi:hypothetical protein
MSELDQFISLMGESADKITATDRQREVFKASLRFAVTYAQTRMKIAAARSERTTNPSPTTISGD